MASATAWRSSFTIGVLMPKCVVERPSIRSAKLESRSFHSRARASARSASGASFDRASARQVASRDCSSSVQIA
jgi:hypothetical protein